MSKRKNGEGTWGTKKIKGSQYYFFRNANGKYFYGKTQKELKKKIADYRENEYLNTRSSSMTFYDYVSYWLKNIKSIELESTTLDRYEDCVSSMIGGYTHIPIGDVKMSDLTTETLQKYANSLANFYSKSSINKVFNVIRPCMRYAVRQRDLTHDIIEDVTLPSESNVVVKEKQVQFISSSDLNKLYNESKRINEPGWSTGGKIGTPVYGVNAQIVIFIAFTGLRISEVRALKWKDIDFEQKILHVNNALVRVKNRESIYEGQTIKDGNVEANKYIDKYKDTKTSSSKRDVPLCDVALEMLDFFHSTNPKHNEDDYVTLNKNGNVPLARNIQKTLDCMLTRADCSVKHCGLHGLRHSFGSILIENGVNIKVISKILGHKNIQTTYNIYIDFKSDYIKKEVTNALNCL